MNPVGALAPHWLDDVIQNALNKGEDPNVIATAIMSSPKVLDAIKRGIPQKPKPGIMSATQAQAIRREVVDAITSTT